MQKTSGFPSIARITPCLCSNHVIFLLQYHFSCLRHSFLFPCPLLLLVFVQSLSHVQLFTTPLDCSTPGFPVLYHPPEFVQTHVHRVSDAIQSSHPLLPPSPPAFNLSGSFPMSQPFATSGQSTGVSASASVLVMNIQGWHPLGLTGLISLLSKGFSRVLCCQRLLISLPRACVLTQLCPTMQSHGL